MRRITILILLALAVVITVHTGCSDRGSNVITGDTDQGAWLQKDHVFFDELLFQIGNQFQQLFVRAYTPLSSFPPPQGTLEKVPLLILLPPQDGDQFYYFQHGLLRIADEMIASGEIEPMAIACINNARSFGGFFYAGDGPASGNYDTLIGGTMIDFLYDNIPWALRGQENLAIGGIGMGAYGAFRAAMLHPGTFSAISAISGPLDFDGPNGVSGFMDYFDDALAEQGLDASTFKQFDSAGAWHLSRLFISGAIAFSPHDTAIEDSIRILGNTILRIIKTRYQIADTMTLITDVVTEDNFNFDFHLPFDGSGQAYTPIWNMWLDNNLESILADQGTGALAGVDIFIGSTPEANYGYYEQTQSWIATLTSGVNNFNVETMEYKGYDGNPATDDQYVYDLLRDILKFHDRKFRGLD